MSGNPNVTFRAQLAVVSSSAVADLPGRVRRRGGASRAERFQVAAVAVPGSAEGGRIPRQQLTAALMQTPRRPLFLRCKHREAAFYKAGRCSGGTRGGRGETRSLTVPLVYVRVPDVVLKGKPHLGAEDNLATLFFDVNILPLCWGHEISSIVKPAPPKRESPGPGPGRPGETSGNSGVVYFQPVGEAVEGLVPVGDLGDLFPQPGVRQVAQQRRRGALGAEHAAVDGDQRGLLLVGQALFGADSRLHRRR